MTAKPYFLHIVLFVNVSAVACGMTKKANPASAFTGTWSGDMELSNAPGETQFIVITIPDDCTPGAVCSQMANDTVSCTWELTLEEVKDNVFRSNFSRVISGGEICSTGLGSSGTMTRQADGMLFREHKGPGFVATGTLRKK
ncbi:MAG: hypothetical protein WHV66_15750 [Anaerolineales bacterium]